MNPRVVRTNYFNLNIRIRVSKLCQIWIHTRAIVTPRNDFANREIMVQHLHSYHVPIVLHFNQSVTPCDM